MRSAWTPDLTIAPVSDLKRVVLDGPSEAEDLTSQVDLYANDRVDSFFDPELETSRDDQGYQDTVRRNSVHIADDAVATFYHSRSDLYANLNATGHYIDYFSYSISYPDSPGSATRDESDPAQAVLVYSNNERANDDIALSLTHNSQEGTIESLASLVKDGDSLEFFLALPRDIDGKVTVRAIVKSGVQALLMRRLDPGLMS